MSALSPMALSSGSISISAARPGSVSRNMAMMPAAMPLKSTFSLINVERLTRDSSSRSSISFPILTLASQARSR